MKIDEFFKKLEEEFGITPYDYSRIRPISLRTLQRCIEGIKPVRNTAEKIEKATGKRVTIKDMGFED